MAYVSAVADINDSIAHAMLSHTAPASGFFARRGLPLGGGLAAWHRGSGRSAEHNLSYVRLRSVSVVVGWLRKPGEGVGWCVVEVDFEMQVGSV